MTTRKQLRNQSKEGRLLPQPIRICFIFFHEFKGIVNFVLRLIEIRITPIKPHTNKAVYSIEFWLCIPYFIHFSFVSSQL